MAKSGFFYLTRRLILSIHTQNQFLWNTNPWARNNRKGLSLGKGFLKCLFRTFGIPSNTGPRTKGCLNQSECSQVQPHPSPPGRGFWTLTPSAPDAPSLAQGHRAGNQEESPTLLPPGPDLQALISTNSIWLPWGIKKNENENNRLIEISCLHGLNDLGKGPTCLCVPWSCVRRRFL